MPVNVVNVSVITTVLFRNFEKRFLKEHTKGFSKTIFFFTIAEIIAEYFELDSNWGYDFLEVKHPSRPCKIFKIQLTITKEGNYPKSITEYYFDAMETEPAFQLFSTIALVARSNWHYSDPLHIRSRYKKLLEYHDRTVTVKAEPA